jgi:uncharacterized protein (DUF1800 family)
MSANAKPSGPRDAAFALHRFGLGPRGDAIARLAADPRGALLAELERPDAALVRDAGLLDTGEVARAVYDFRQERKAVRFAQRAEQATSTNNNATNNNATNGNVPPAPNASQPPKPQPNPGPALPQQIFLAEAKARFDRALDADTGFIERLVWFWSNHFCVSADKVRPFAGAFEREAIRPHVLGRFADMLLAVESHPAMLHYLDNVRSIGPDSIAGQRQHKGINENLAREIMELHTLGVRTGYTQEDVTSFAKVISGWTVIPPRNRDGGGEFNFNPRMHQPGAETVAGRTYAGMGFDQGTAVLLDLARNPATARHIATKFARHFVADDPPPGVVAALIASFAKSDGDLKEMAQTLLLSPEAWSAPRSKLKRPGEWVIGAGRATDVHFPDVRPLINFGNLLGEPLWRPPAPKGFDDVNAAWIDGLAQRIDIANQAARRVIQAAEPHQLVDTALGPLASAETRQAVARAETRPEAIALLLMSPEFLRR